MVKNPPANAGDLGPFPGEEMSSHSRILAWEIPWTEEPAGPQSMGSPRVGHDLELNNNNPHKNLTSFSPNSFYYRYSF